MSTLALQLMSLTLIANLVFSAILFFRGGHNTLAFWHLALAAILGLVIGQNV